ncbi:Uncharacterised protein [Acinetobacter baumannii]|nr:Uncharacterised protein [Acinetobacter baumannii]SSS41489.1 Uncharacterised protein [Acinetobacter baumannii]
MSRLARNDEGAQANIPVQKCPVAMHCIELCLQATDQVELQAVPAVRFAVKNVEWYNGPNHLKAKVHSDLIRLHFLSFLRLKFLNINVRGKSHPVSTDGCLKPTCQVFLKDKIYLPKA